METVNRLYEQIISQIDYSREIPNEEIKERIDQVIGEESKKALISVAERQRLRRELFARIRELDILQEMIDDPEITEIMVNGTEPIFIEKRGELFITENRFDSQDKLMQVIQQIVAQCNRTVNEASPIVDARLQNGSRVNVVLPPIALNGPILTIRRFPEQPITMEQLILDHSLTGEASELLRLLVRAGYNILISGGTGSGKTTFLNALAGYIPSTERILVVEDSSELQIRNIPNLVRMETRNVNVEGCKPITIRDLIKTSLRMRPSRIIVGEVRGSETIDMLQALNTGHSSMTTCHANSAKDVVSRLETMVLMGMDFPIEAIRRQIASALDIIVHLGRLRDGSRHVLEIVEIFGYCQGEVTFHPLYSFEEYEEEQEEGSPVQHPEAQEEDLPARGKKQKDNNTIKGRLQKKGELQHVQKLKASGLWKEAKEGDTL